jgi:AcrR family transcriptional regulator
MSAQGVDATTIQQITDAADVGFGTFYNYAASKEALAQDVLDCMIHNVGERNDLITQQLGEVDPVRIVANSVRFVIREMTTNPVYRWWVARLDLLADRMRIGFGPFAARHRPSLRWRTAHRRQSGAAWSQALLAHGRRGRDILEDYRPEDERSIVEGILRERRRRMRPCCTRRRAILPARRRCRSAAFEID